MRRLIVHEWSRPRPGKRCRRWWPIGLPGPPFTRTPRSTGSHPEQVNREERTTGAEPLSKRLTILLTEGNATLREVAARSPISQGYHARTASDDKAALAILATEDVCLPLLDLTSLEMNGLAVLPYVQRERRGRFPDVVVLSGVLTEAERRKVQELGADE